MTTVCQHSEDDVGEDDVGEDDVGEDDVGEEHNGFSQRQSRRCRCVLWQVLQK
jgi:hypothetical protein